MEFHVSLIGRKDLSGEIYRQLRRAIIDGRVQPGEFLPPTRELARHLGVARTTVMVAYDRLVGEGFVARYICVARGMEITADDVSIVSGTQQGLDVVARSLLAPGDRVAVEDPGYPPVRWLLESLRARVSSVPVDEEGLVVSALPRRARVVYVTPSHQYPLGMSMTLRRRRALLEWAERLRRCFDSQRAGPGMIKSPKMPDRERPPCPAASIEPAPPGGQRDARRGAP